MQSLRNWQRLAVVAILLLAFGLRFYRLDAQSFWNDEGNSARLSERSFTAIVEGTASDIHPPLYYLLLRGWREMVGASEFGLRSFSSFFGVGTVALTMATMRGIDLGESQRGARRRQKQVAASIPFLLAGLLTAVSPPLIYYSQETRMYALLAFEALLATYFLTRIPWSVARNRNADRGPRATAYVPYLLTVTAGLYTHYFFPAVLLGHGLFLGWRFLQELRRRRATRSHPFVMWLGTMVLAGLLYLPWLPIFLRQAGGRPGARISLLTFLGDSFRWLAFGSTIGDRAAAWAVPAVGLLVILGVAVALFANGRSSVSSVPLLMFATPVLMMIAAGTIQPEFYKFMLISVPFLAMLVAQFCTWERPGQKPEADRMRRFAARGRLLASILVLPITFLACALSLQNLYFEPAYARADYRSMAARIEADNHPDAGVILNAPNQWEVFTYYYPDADRVYPLPRGQPDPNILEPELAAIAARHERIYAIFWGEAQRDPQRLVERWLDTHAFKATEEWIGDVRFVIYAVPGAQSQEMATAVSLPFGSSILLQGYSLQRETLQPGDIIQLALFWETGAALEQRYKVFLHLVDEAGQLVAQRDSEPGGGLALTTTWQPGTTIIDNHGVLVPIETPPGTYTLVVGLYDVADPTARLLIILDSGKVDTFPLATIQVE